MKNEHGVKITTDELVSIIVKNCPYAIMLDGLDECIIGVHIGLAQTNIIYSYGRIIHLLMRRDKMSFSDAGEFFDYNIAGLHFPIDVRPYFVRDDFMNPSMN